MYYGFKSADISGCCTVIRKPNGLSRPSNSNAPADCGALDGSAPPPSPPKVFFFLCVFNPRSKFPEKLVWIFRANGVTFF